MQKITHFKAVPVMCGLTFMYDSSANQFKTILLAMHYAKKEAFIF